jgi:ABC-type glycerol-3-phosphate transport system permease component
MTARALPRYNPVAVWTYRHREKILAVTAFASVLVVILPAVWLVLSSLKTNRNLFRIPPQIIPAPFTLRNYQEALAGSNFPRYMLNSLFLGTSSTVICVIFSALAAYAFTYLHFRGRGLMLGIVVGTQFFPAATLLLPLYRLWVELRLFDTYTALIATYVAISLSLCTWLLIGFFETVPSEVIDAATIDGCTRFGTLWRIILPISRPGILACGAYVFIGIWQEFLLAVTFISSPNLRTVTVGLYSFITEHRVQWNLLIAASVAISIPTIILFGLLQRYLVEGIAAGALK